MRRNQLLSLCMILMLCLSSCGSGNAQSAAEEAKESSDMTNGVRMTREYAIEHGILTEEDLEGVDFDAMAEQYDWQEGTEVDWDIKNFVNILKDDYLLPGYGFDYSWLTSDTEQEEKFAKEDIEQIKVIGFEYQAGDYLVGMIFDLGEGKAYFLENKPLYRARYAEFPEGISLTDEQISKVRKVMADCAVYRWNKRYEGTDDFSVSDSNFWWHLYYALEDGRLYSNSGSGGFGNSTPDNWSTLRDGFRDFWN